MKDTTMNSTPTLETTESPDLMFSSLLLPSAVRLRLRRVTAECFSANEPSCRLMERLGMRRKTHTVSESLHRSGAW